MTHRYGSHRRRENLEDEHEHRTDKDFNRPWIPRRVPKFSGPEEITVRLSDHALRRVKERLMGNTEADTDAAGNMLAQQLKRGIIIPHRNEQGMEVLGFKDRWFIFMLRGSPDGPSEPYQAVTFELTTRAPAKGRPVRVTYELRVATPIEAPVQPSPSMA
ncbi:MAG TPA: hypothetical protein VL944_02185 [Candidatus Acidoferrum sp.]|nr:hypothetical protein [Candidatus Acidoferrum sp.]